MEIIYIALFFISLLLVFTVNRGKRSTRLRLFQEPPEITPWARGAGNVLGLLLFAGLSWQFIQYRAQTEALPELPPTDGSTRVVEASQFGQRWPLRVPKGTLECLPNQVVVFHTQGKTYAVNGIAKEQGYIPIEKLTERSPQFSSQNRDLTPLLDTGLKLCR